MAKDFKETQSRVQAIARGQRLGRIADKASDRGVRRFKPGAGKLYKDAHKLAMKLYKEKDAAKAASLSKKDRGDPSVVKGKLRQEALKEAAASMVATRAKLNDPKLREEQKKLHPERYNQPSNPALDALMNTKPGTRNFKAPKALKAAGQRRWKNQYNEGNW